VVARFLFVKMCTETGKGAGTGLSRVAVYRHSPDRLNMINDSLKGT